MKEKRQKTKKMKTTKSHTKAPLFKGAVARRATGGSHTPKPSKNLTSNIQPLTSDPKGITIIALIITIVIMLILVSISIKLVINGDLLNQAGKAVKKTNEKVGQTQDRVDELMGTLTEIEQNQCEHEWGEWEIVIEETCTTDGTKKRTCIICGKVEQGSITRRTQLC